MKRASFRRLIAAFVLATVVICAVPASAIAKDYSMGPVSIHGTVAEDASMTVTESRTFSFDGDYSFVYWEFKKTDGVSYRIKGLEQVDGKIVMPYGPATDASSNYSYTYRVEDSPTSTKVTAYFSASDEDVTFRLTYDVLGGVKRYQDTGEVYWQAVGSEWGATTKDIKVDVSLPVPAGTKVEAGKDVRAWGHGPLNGTVSIKGDGTVRLEVPRVDEGTFVEMRAIFPAEWLATAPVTQEDKLDQILADEQKWADEANAQRARARALVYGFNIGVTALGVALLGFSVFAYLRWGKEYKPKFQDHYLREVPTELHPAVAGALWSWGTVGEKEFTATLMNLSVQRVVTITPQSHEVKGLLGTKTEEDYVLTVDRAKAAALTDPIDISLVDFLFHTVSKGRDTLSFKAITEYGKEHAQTFVDKMNDWKAEVKAVPAAKGFFESTGSALMILTLFFGFLLVGLGILGAALTGGWYPVAAGIVLAIPLFILAPNMRRRSPEATELEAKYRALRNYLKDFSKLDEAPPMHVILWEKFLVMAVIFGISEEVIRQLAITMPALVGDPGFLPVYFWVIPHGSLAAPSEAFRGTVLSASQVAQSAMSSGGGFGGGFSGGGGGGFGGGGGGAG